jgi:Alpha-(1,6)-fucosyltransferase N- and catalytic domains
MRITREQLFAAISEPEKIMVYSFGCWPTASFNADYLGLVDRLMACLQLGIGFRLCKIRSPQSFVVKNGWTDYFEPFCDIATGAFLDRINRHQFPFAKKLPVVKPVARLWLKCATRPRADYFQFDDLKIETLGPPIFEPNENYLSARRDLIGLLWTYNAETAREVERIKGEISPKNYIGLCIRRGDKIAEYSYVDIYRYVESISILANDTRTVFVATDDVKTISEISNIMPHYEFISLTENNARGYIHSEFKRLPGDERRRRTIRFFAQLELLRDASLFIGSRTTNVSWMVNAHRGGDRVVWVD